MSPKDFQIVITRHKETVTVSLAGEAHIDFEAADTHLSAVLNHHPKLVVVDASKMTFITSIGICFLINLRRAVRAIGGTMRLQGLQPRMRKVMEHAHVIHLFDVLPDAKPTS